MSPQMCVLVAGVHRTFPSSLLCYFFFFVIGRQHNYKAFCFNPAQNKLFYVSSEVDWALAPQRCTLMFTLAAKTSDQGSFNLLGLTVYHLWHHWGKTFQTDSLSTFSEMCIKQPRETGCRQAVGKYLCKNGKQIKSLFNIMGPLGAPTVSTRGFSLFVITYL